MTRRFSKLEKYIRGLKNSENISIVNARVDGNEFQYEQGYLKNNAICVYSLFNNQLVTIINEAHKMGYNIHKQFTKLATGNLYEVFIY